MEPLLPLSLCDEHVAEVGVRVGVTCVSSHENAQKMVNRVRVHPSLMDPAAAHLLRLETFECCTPPPHAQVTDGCFDQGEMEG